MRVRVYPPRRDEPNHPLARRIAADIPPELLRLSDTLLRRDICQRHGVCYKTAAAATTFARTAHEAP